MDDIGRKIRDSRERRKLSVADVADRSALSEAFIESIEAGRHFPSLRPLVKISRALGVRLGSFLDDHVSSDPLVVRLGERTEELTLHMDDARPGMRFHSLGKGKTDRHMEPFFIELPPLSGEAPKDDGSLSSHEGEEFILVQSGQVRVRYGDEDTLLGPGDSIYFNSVTPHSVSSADDAQAEIYAVLYFPE